jgi:hypothetical protein
MSVVARIIWAGMRIAWSATVRAFIFIWRAVSGALRVAWNATWGFIKRIAAAAWLYLRIGWRVAVNALLAIARFFGRVFTTAWNVTWNFMKRIAARAWAFLRAGWRVATNALLAIGRFFGRIFTTAWNVTWNFMKRIASRAWAFLRAGWRVATGALLAIARFFGRIFTTAWNVTWNFMKRIAGGAWNWIKNGWKRFTGILHGFLILWGRRFSGMWRNIWNGIKGFFAGKVKNFLVKTIPNTFKQAVSLCGRAWNLLKKAVSAPVRAVVDVVYNKGIVKLWNVVAGAFGAPKLKGFSFKGFKDGGYTGGGSASSPAGIVHGKEYVLTAGETRKMGGPQGVEAWKNGQWGQRQKNVRSSRTKGGVIPSRYAGIFGKGVGGRPVDDGCGGAGGVLGFVQDIGCAIAGGVGKAFRAASGFSGDVLKKIGGLALGTIAPVANPALQGVADIGKKVVRNIIPGSPGTEKLIAGTGKKLNGKEGGSNLGDGMIQAMVQIVKDYITEKDQIAGCGASAAPKWKAGDGARTSFRGATVNKRTAKMLAQAEKICGCKFSITQGSWSNASASAGTHSGGGAVDIAGPSNKKVGALRAAGFAAWNRGAKWGSASFSPHIHAIAMGDRTASAGAKQQMKDYTAGKNGLAGGGKDNFKDKTCSGGKPGDCNSYKPMAAMALQRAGINKNQLGKFMSLMKKESGCRPNAANNWDSNAKAGMASKGLMQVIPPTFKANHCPGTSNNILDPFANMCAAAKYIKSRYGGRVPGSPYQHGTKSAARGWHMVGETGPEMVRFGGGETVRSNFRTRQAMGEGSGTVTTVAGGGGGDIHVHIHGTVYAKSELEFERMVAGTMQNLKRKGRMPK